MTQEDAIPKPKDFDPDYYYQTMTRMASDGKEVDITLECSNNLMSCMVDKFGATFPFEPIDNEHFQATVHVATGRTFWSWVFEHSGLMKVVAPESAKLQYRALLLRSLED